MDPYVRFLEDVPMFDIDIACVKRLAICKNIPIDEQSPLYSVTPSETAKNKGTEEDESLLKLTQVLSMPQMIANFSKAGMGESDETFTIYARYVDTHPYFVFVQTYEMKKRLLLFDHIEELATYIVSRYGTMNTNRSDKIDDFQTDINHFVFLLNIIDTIKRRYLSGLLDGKQVSQEYLSLDAYREELDFSLRNSDVRWLLPSALRLIPKFHQFKMEFDPLKFELQMPHHLISKYQMADVDDTQFFLSDEIKRLGLSFTHYWKYAIGFELKLLSYDYMPSKRYYLAPTDESNHFFSLDEPFDKGICRYSALAFDELIVELENIFKLGMGIE